MKLLYKILLPLAVVFIPTVGGIFYWMNYTVQEVLFEQSFHALREHILIEGKNHFNSDVFEAGAGHEIDSQHFKSFSEEFKSATVGRLTVWNREKQIVYSDLQSIQGMTDDSRNDIENVFLTKQAIYQHRSVDTGEVRQSNFGPFLDILIPLEIAGAETMSEESVPLVVEVQAPVSAMTGPLNRLMVKFGLILGLSFVAVFLSIFLVARLFITRPIKRLQEAMNALESGHWERVSQVNSKDEIGQLGKDFEKMAQVLRATIAELQEEKNASEVAERAVEKQNELLKKSRKATLNVLEDVTRSEQELLSKTEDLKKFRQAVDTGFDPTIITDADGTILFANNAIEILTGYSVEECLGNKPSLWGGQMPQQFYETLWRTIKTEKSRYTGELKNKKKDGTLYLASMRIVPILDDAGEVKFFVAVQRNITEERESQLRILRHASELETANKRIQLEKERAESILNFLQSIDEKVYVVDLERTIIFINKATAKLLGTEPSYILGTHMSDHFVYEVGDGKRYTPTKKVLADKRTHTFPDNTFVKIDGKRMAVAGAASPIFDKNQQLVGAVVVFQDMSKRYELEQMKDNFLSVAAHQLRTPLGSMRWSMELLLSGDLGKLPKTAKEAVQQVYDNSGRMLLLVNDLLDVSRIDRERGKEERKPVDLVMTLKEVIKAMKPGAEKRHVKIVLKVPKKSLPAIMAPPKHLYEAFENLISNGIKYNREKGVLTVSVSLTDTSVELEFADTGIGIPEVDQGKIFSKFYRATNAVQKETEGSGLGLSVVKSYLEEAGAKVHFESKENVGTTFFVRFPFHSTES